MWYRPPERTSSTTPAVLEEMIEVPTSMVEGTWDNVKEGDGDDDSADIDGDGDCLRTRVRHGEVRCAMLKELGYWPTIHNGRISAASPNAAAPNGGNFLFQGRSLARAISLQSASGLLTIYSTRVRNLRFMAYTHRTFSLKTNANHLPRIAYMRLTG